ncbi:MAG TPA: hypothetical protein VIX20_18875 [Ktedonobacteraceae bacterium]
MKEIKRFYLFENEEFRKFTLLEGRLALTGLIAISVIMLPVLVSTGTPDLFSKISLITLAISIPLLVFTFLFAQIPGNLSEALLPRRVYFIVFVIYVVFGSLGMTGATVGINLAIYHTYPLAGILFFVSAIVCILTYFFVQFIVWHLQENKEKLSGQKPE